MSATYCSLITYKLTGVDSPIKIGKWRTQVNEAYKIKSDTLVIVIEYS